MSDKQQTYYVEIRATNDSKEARACAFIILERYLAWAEEKVNIDATLIRDDRYFSAYRYFLKRCAVLGISEAVIRFRGQGIRNLLKNEAGMHLVTRRSPFDPGNRRHTSFVIFNVFAGILEPEVHQHHYEINEDGSPEKTKRCRVSEQIDH